MERYKVYEREAKTKAYSKEGLQSQREKAKREDARSEITRWLQRSIDELKVHYSIHSLVVVFILTKYFFVNFALSPP